MTTIGVFVATRWELGAVRQAFASTDLHIVGGIRCHVARQSQIEWWMIPMGVGPERAAATASNVLGAKRLDALWSTGFACALGPAAIGDVLIGTGVTRIDGVTLSQPVACASSMVEWVRQAVEAKGVKTQCGGFVTVPRVLCRAEEKRAVADLVNGVGLDMESAALGQVATAQGIPFAIVRTVSDLVDESLPLDFNLFLRPSGWAKGVASCVAHPSSLIGLNRLRVQSRIAGEQLTSLYRACADRASHQGIA